MHQFQLCIKKGLFLVQKRETLKFTLIYLEILKIYFEQRAGIIKVLLMLVFSKVSYVTHGPPVKLVTHYNVDDFFAENQQILFDER